MHDDVSCHGKNTFWYIHIFYKSCHQFFIQKTMDVKVMHYFCRKFMEFIYNLAKSYVGCMAIHLHIMFSQHGNSNRFLPWQLPLLHMGIRKYFLPWQLFMRHAYVLSMDFISKTFAMFSLFFYFTFGTWQTREINSPSFFNSYKSLNLPRFLTKKL